MSASTATSSPAAPKHGAGRLGKHPGVILALLVTCYLMIIVDNNVVTIALPQIQDSLHMSATGLSWVLSSYTLTFGGLLLLGGRAGDVFGRRRVFVTGVVLFTVSSLLGGLATTAWWLLAARAVQGLGAALASPGAMALLMTNFKEGPARNRALAVYSTLAGLGMAIGMILGGLLTEWTSWRWVLFINVPFGVVVAVLTPIYIADPERHPGRVDIAGALTGTAATAALVYGFIRASEVGWGDPLTLSAFAAAVVLLAVFLVVQRLVPHPTVPLQLFADRNRAAGYATVLLTMACLFGVLFFISQFLQDILHYSALQAGLAFLPMAAGMFGMSRCTPWLLPRVGALRLILIGLAVVAGGAGWLSRLGEHTAYAPGLLVPMLMLGVGIGTFLMPLTALILGGVAPRDAGAAAGVMQTMQQVGGSLGLAILVTVYGTTLRHGAASTPALTAHAMGNAFVAATVSVVLAFILVAVAIRPSRRAA
ncbi:MFS transporter [Dactylosporangium siamense]|uniref:MFS transporter n=1 Tax=Dactylosporangium siamense TaxID=685454 RepID=A0A919PFG1_9ACTN|nr:MFS transporter [Dactylosporangium siamense]GIG42604.1 MFS transporter [Dactylosporangium siamense]